MSCIWIPDVVLISYSILPVWFFSYPTNYSPTHSTAHYSFLCEAFNCCHFSSLKLGQHISWYDKDIGESIVFHVIDVYWCFQMCFSRYTFFNYQMFIFSGLFIIFIWKFHIIFNFNSYKRELMIPSQSHFISLIFNSFTDINKLTYTHITLKFKIWLQTSFFLSFTLSSSLYLSPKYIMNFLFLIFNLPGLWPFSTTRFYRLTSCPFFISFIL